MVFLELRRDSRVTTGNSGCLLCWPRQVQSSIRVAKESWPKKSPRFSIQIKRHILFQRTMINYIRNMNSVFTLCIHISLVKMYPKKIISMMSLLFLSAQETLLLLLLLAPQISWGMPTPTSPPSNHVFQWT